MKPTVGRIVNYVSYGGALWPALITRVHNATLINAYVFPGDGSPAVAVTKLRFSGEAKPNSWHWPVREDAPAEAPKA